MSHDTAYLLCCHVNRFAAWHPQGRILISTEPLCGRQSNALLPSCIMKGQLEPPRCLCPGTAALRWSDDTQTRQNTTKVMWQRGSDVDGVGQMVESQVKVTPSPGIAMADQPEVPWNYSFIPTISWVISSKLTLFSWSTQSVCRSFASMGFCLTRRANWLGTSRKVWIDGAWNTHLFLSFHEDQRQLTPKVLLSDIFINIVPLQLLSGTFIWSPFM